MAASAQGIEDRIRGVVYGQAVGDALGLGAEFMSKREVRRFYPKGLKDFAQIIRDAHRSRWPRGAWTDDTDQMLCIFDSLLAKRTLDVLDVAQRLRSWVLGGGTGVGDTVFAVIRHPRFLADPRRASRDAWMDSGEYAAANGALMRTSILGVWEYENTRGVVRNAEAACRITHYDSRCAGSCVALCLAISAFLRGDEDAGNMFDLAAAAACAYDSRASECFDRASRDDIEALELDEENRIGYTFKALGSAFWALMHARSFEEGLLAVVNEGGDADTNGAVTGSLLGARFGFSGIPTKLVDGLLGKEELETRLARLFASGNKTLPREGTDSIPKAL